MSIQVFNATKECNDNISGADVECDTIDQEKGKFTAELSDLESQVKIKKSELKKFEQEIDEKSVQKVFKILDKKCPEALGKMTESMVALLRG